MVVSTRTHTGNHSGEVKNDSTFNERPGDDLGAMLVCEPGCEFGSRGLTPLFLHVMGSLVTTGSQKETMCF